MQTLVGLTCVAEDASELARSSKATAGATAPALVSSSLALSQSVATLHSTAAAWPATAHNTAACFSCYRAFLANWVIAEARCVAPPRMLCS